MQEAKEEIESINVDASEAGSMGESEESAPRFRRRKIQEKASTVSRVPSVLQEAPEATAAREARIAAEKAMQDAILLIQSHERARMGRCAGFERTDLINKYNKISIHLFIFYSATDVYLQPKATAGRDNAEEDEQSYLRDRSEDDTKSLEKVSGEEENEETGGSRGRAIGHDDTQLEV